MDEYANRHTLKKNHVQCGKNLRIRGRIFIENRGGKILLGDDVIINSKYRNNPIGGDTFTSIVAERDAVIRIGNHVGLSNSAFFSKLSITIEDNVMIGGSCRFYDTDFHSVRPSERTLETEDHDIASKPILIRSGSFFGAHTIILKGVTIGRNCVVGAGSVVTKDIPDNEIWAGNPARLIRKLM